MKLELQAPYLHPGYKVRSCTSCTQFCILFFKEKFPNYINFRPHKTWIDPWVVLPEEIVENEKNSGLRMKSWKHSHKVGEKEEVAYEWAF